MSLHNLVQEASDRVQRKCVTCLNRFLSNVGPSRKRTPVADAWTPKVGPETILLRWFMTEWCNQSCPYCGQTHDRRAGKGNGFTAHCFDNFSPEKWVEAFRRHFEEKRLSLVLTGGEPMLDRKTMTFFLNSLSEMPSTDCIRIDTNAWWNSESWTDLDRSKLILMCTYHPSQTSFDAFMGRIKSFQSSGFEIGMINYVMDESNRVRYIHIRDEFRKIGLPLHPNPLWDGRGLYSKADLQILGDNLPPSDFDYRSQSKSPRGKRCYFPSVAYEMDFRGNIHVGCHSTLSGSFFDQTLPRRFECSVLCPHSSCVCLDKYSFLEVIGRNTTTNPLRTYSSELKKLYGISSS